MSHIPLGDERQKLMRLKALMEFGDRFRNIEQLQVEVERLRAENARLRAAVFQAHKLLGPTDKPCLCPDCAVAQKDTQ